ncbi:MAG: transcription elongation factor GreA, partial [Actinobacteria bacterium]|nr:transcription elongation factor GreA [Actinomycetota bacterium]
LRENAGYHAAKDKQGHMEGRIRQLEHLLENAEITESLRVYTIVYKGDSPDDAEKYVVGDPEEVITLGRDDVEVMTPTSPLGAALAEAEATAGQTVEYEAPNGRLRIEILSIEEI